MTLNEQFVGYVVDRSQEQPAMDLQTYMTNQSEITAMKEANVIELRVRYRYGRSDKPGWWMWSLLQLEARDN